MRYKADSAVKIIMAKNARPIVVKSASIIIVVFSKGVEYDTFKLSYGLLHSQTDTLRNTRTESTCVAPNSLPRCCAQLLYT